MGEDDKRRALRDLLKERCPDIEFSDDDVHKLVGNGYTTAADLAASTKEDLVAVLPGRRSKVGLLFKAFVQPAGNIQDLSEHWIKHMLLPELPELPRNAVELETVLFPHGDHQKLPVTPPFYTIQAATMPGLAKKFLIEADGSSLPSALSTYLETGPAISISTEMDTPIFVGSIIRQIFYNIDRLTSYDFEFILAFNSTERQSQSYSATTELRSRPDTILTASGCTFLVGEYKRNELFAAESDLMREIQSLNRMYYGDVRFILGYTAAGSQFQWVYLGVNDFQRIGAPLNLSKLEGRCKFILSLGRAFLLIQSMASSVPQVPGRRAMFSVEESPSRKRISFFGVTEVTKHIRDFTTHSAEQGTSLSVIRKAYDAAEGYSYLLQAKKKPTVSRHGCYKVVCSPLGYSCSLNMSEQDCQWMAKCVCHALVVLHGAGLVHKDIRLPNIVRLSEKEFMLIDFESVAEHPFRGGAGFLSFSGWYPETLDDESYTYLSDMFSLGKLVERALPNSRTRLAEEFVKNLTNKQLDAADALQDPWLSGLIA